jgi:dephospho-CoA kinase
MKIIGLTGGIGSGKSTVARLFEILGIPVYNTDEEAKRITSSSSTVKQALSDRFGTKLYPDGRLDKELFSSLIFNNEENLRYANAVIHPEVKKDFLMWTEQYRTIPFVAVESAILFESGMDEMSDVTINVSSPLETRIERVQKRDHLSRESVLNRINNQMSEEERIAKSDYTIKNDGCSAILPQIENRLKVLE